MLHCVYNFIYCGLAEKIHTHTYSGHLTFQESDDRENKNLHYVSSAFQLSLALCHIEFLNNVFLFKIDFYPLKKKVRKRT